jgi:hypothetical protein
MTFGRENETNAIAVLDMQCKFELSETLHVADRYARGPLQLHRCTQKLLDGDSSQG